MSVLELARQKILTQEQKELEDDILRDFEELK